MNALFKLLNLSNLSKYCLAGLILVSNFCFSQKQAINLSLDQWHEAAADANAQTYFSLMTKDAVFVGTDADEVWPLNDFKAFAMPYFKKGKAWTFKAIERHIYLGKENTAWFDEVLNSSHMGLCRGSGVMVFEDQRWKIQHYVLSILIPNEQVKKVFQEKKEHDETLVKLKRN